MKIKLIVSIAMIVLSLGILARPVVGQTIDSYDNSPSIEIPLTDSPRLDQKIIAHAKQKWPQYVIRASGLIAIDLLILLMISGIGHITGHTYKFIEPIAAWGAHKAMGIAFAATLVIHILTILFDHASRIGTAGLFVPFVEPYRPTSWAGFNFRSLFLALGIIAFYATIAVVVTSLHWVNTKTRPWKLIHLLSYVILVFSLLHAFFIGTDLAKGLVRGLFIVISLALLLFSTYRLWRAKII